MKTTTRTPTRSTRSLRFWPSGDEFSAVAGLLEITVRGERTTYVVQEYPTGYAARGFYLSKTDGSEGYSVTCSRHGAAGDSCDCPQAYYRRAGGPCKHAAALRALVSAGRI